MSHTTDDLRERLANDLADFGTLPSVAERALQKGRKTRRRRGTASVVLGMVAVSVVVAALTSDARDSTNAVDSATSPPSSTSVTTTTSPTPTPDAPGLSTNAWNQHAVEVLSSLLPARYGGVRLQSGGGSWTLFRTVSGGQNVDFHFEFYAREGLYGYDLGTCGDDIWWMSSCEYTDPPGPWRGRVFHQKVGTDESGSGPVQGEPAGWHYGGGAELSGPSADVVLVGFPVDDTIPLGLTNAEVRAVVEDPAFVALLDQH